LQESDTPYTPAIALVKALAESLRVIQTVGIEQVWARAQVLARAMRAGIEALGLRLVAARPADGMTAVYLPDGLDGKQFLARLQSRFGVKFAGGQGPLKGRIFRIAHMGIADELDIVSALAAVELVLAEMGQNVKLGASVAAASQILAGDADGVKLHSHS
jgi:aspartate aminotransferase-like enzyme